MESLIPQILFLGPVFAPVLLRLGAGVAYALLAAHLYKNRSLLAEGPFPIIGRPGSGPIAFGALVSAALALAFVVGLWTQVAALLGFVGGVKGVILAKKFPALYPWGRMAFFLIALMCLILVMTGGGAFAIDKPY